MLTWLSSEGKIITHLRSFFPRQHLPLTWKRRALAPEAPLKRNADENKHFWIDYAWVSMSWCLFRLGEKSEKYCTKFIFEHVNTDVSSAGYSGLLDKYPKEFYLEWWEMYILGCDYFTVNLINTLNEIFHNIFGAYISLFIDSFNVLTYFIKYCISTS